VLKNSDIDYTILISDQCEELENCDINDKYSGVWRPLNYYIDLEAKYPGETCIYPSWTQECSYGTQKCTDGKCESVGHDGKCAESRDWESYQYCAGSTTESQDGSCTKFKQIGDEWDHPHEWGRTSTCWFRNTTGGVKGTWKDYFQISSNDTTNLAWNEHGNMIQNAEDSNLLCQSQHYNLETGVCSSGAISLNKGKDCVVDADCPTDVTGEFASCACGWSTGGNKYWDILAGDDEWESARTAFKSYFDETKDKWNVASRWGEWGVSSLYNDWMCKKLKAENYVYLLYNDTDLPCMAKLKTSLPIFKDVEKYWGNAFGTFIEGILFASALLHLML